MNSDFVEEVFTVTIRRIPSTMRLANETWCNQLGDLDRDGGLPAFVIYGEDGQTDQEWWQNGVRHREDGPSIIYSRNSESNQPTYEAWYRHGVLHRDGDEPAETDRMPDGRIVKLAYAHNGQLHRANGPAVIERSWSTGRIIKKEFWRHGVKIPPPQNKKHMPFPT